MNKKIIYILLIISFIMSCKEDEVNIIPIEDRKVIVFNKSYFENTDFIDNNEFNLITLQDTTPFFTKIDTLGNITELINLDNIFIEDLTIDSISTINILKTNDKGHQISYILNDKQTVIQQKYNSEFTIEWQFKDSLPVLAMNSLLFQNEINNNINFIYYQNFPPTENKFSIKKRVFSDLTGELLDTFSISYSESSLIDVYKADNYDFIFLSGQIKGNPQQDFYSVEQLNVHIVENQNTNSISTGLSTSKIIDVVDYEDNIYIFYYVSFSEIKIAKINLNSGLEWEKDFSLQQEGITYYIEKVVKSENNVIALGYSEDFDYDIEMFFAVINKDNEIQRSGSYQVDYLNWINCIINEFGKVSMLFYYNNNVAPNNIFLIKANEFGQIN